VDEIVWAVNPKHDTLESLASYLEKFAIDFLGLAGIRCRLDLPLETPWWQLSSEARHHLFLAYKEALNNIAKHSGASEARIRLTLAAAAFELEMADNGCGFVPPEHGRTRDQQGGHLGGNGLTTMQRRLQDIGGVCDIKSIPGQGTRVTFYVALKPAAGSSGKRI